MITLGLRLQDDFPRQYRLFSTRTFTYGGKNYRNHNTLLARYRGTDGIKTGYTRASGFNLVSSVRRDGKHVVAAVFGGDTARERNAKMQSLLNAALAKASTKVTRKPALVARAPQPTRAARPRCKLPRHRARRSRCRRLAAAPPSPRERDTAIAVAKVRPVRIGSEPRARASSASRSPERTQPVFAVAGAGGAMPPPRAPGDAEQAFPRFVPETGALQPSTLQAQAAQLEAGNAPPAPRPLAALAPEAPRARRHAPAARADRSKFRSGPSAIPPRRSGAWRPPASAPAACSMPIAASPSRCRAAQQALSRAVPRLRRNRRQRHLLALATMQIDCFVIKTE